MSSLWLNKKRKSELVALCDQLDLETDGFRKTDLETILSEYLEAHESELASDSTFSAFYDDRTMVRTVKSPMGVALDVTEKRTRRRTTTSSRYGGSSIDQASSAEETTPEPIVLERKTRSGSRPLGTRTPRTATRSLRQAIQAPLPPSPAVVANDIETRANSLVASAKESFKNAEVQQRATGVRDALSNVVSVNAVALTLELAYLFHTLIPRTYEVTLPAISALGSSARIFVLPDLFVLLTAAFWSPFLTWVATSIAGPLANALLFNLVATSVKADGADSTHKVDPLTFAVTKTLVAWLVHYKQFNFWGLLGDAAVDTVGASVGRELQLVTAGLGGTAALWEAILKK